MAKVPRRPCARCGKDLPAFSMAQRCPPCSDAELRDAREQRRQTRRRKTDNRNLERSAGGPNATLPTTHIRFDQFAKLYPDANADQFRRRLAKYQLTLGQWQWMIEFQGSCCGICGKSMPALALHIDHCHQTGKVRGLLCATCNTGLGLLGVDGHESNERVQSVIRYLTQTRKSATAPFHDPLVRRNVSAGHVARIRAERNLDG